MLWKRIVTAAILAALLAVVLLYLPESWALAALAALTLAGAWEWAAFAGLQSRISRIAYVAVMVLAMAGLWAVSATTGGLTAVVWLALAWWAVAFLWIVACPQRGHPALSALAGLLALAPMWVAMGRLYQAGQQGHELVVMVLLLAWAADIGAYFAGRRFGQQKLVPRVSPNKTWEGALGGLLAAALVALAGQAWFGFNAAGFLPLCIAVALASIVGDLTESLFKRQAGLKDSGRLLPGHGGVLDRIDSLTAAVPVFALGLIWLGALE